MKSLLRFSGYAVVILALFFIPVIVYCVSLVQKSDKAQSQVLAATIDSPIQPTQGPKQSKLADIVNLNFANDEKDYAVVIKNLKTDEEYRFHENVKYDSASLYKLWVLSVVKQKMKDGAFSEEDSLVGDLAKLDKTLSTDPEPATPSPEVASEDKKEEEPKRISMTVKDAMEKMIIHSDNYAALLLTQKVKPSTITKFLKEYGFVNSKFGSPPRTNAHDIALFYEKLYKGEIVDEENSREMIELLKRQAINDRLPKYLPRGISVAHKTGELYGSKHDAGIVFSEKGDYIIVVMTNTKDPAFAAERVAKFSKEVYEYFEEENQIPN